MLLRNARLKIALFFLVMVLTVAFGVATTYGQYEQLCGKIERSINQKLKHIEVQRNEPASYGCDIDYSFPDLTIDLEVYKSEEMSLKGFNSTVRLYRTVRVDEKLKPENKLSYHGTWNEAILIPSRDSNGSHVLLLRTSKYVITLLSPDRELLLNVEEIIRPFFNGRMKVWGHLL